jgi:hypothetical protein
MSFVDFDVGKAEGAEEVGLVIRDTKVEDGKGLIDWFEGGGEELERIKSDLRIYAGWLKEHVECYPNVKVVTITLPAGVTATVYTVAVGKFERVLGFFGGLVDAMTLGGLWNW